MFKVETLIGVFRFLIWLLEGAKDKNDELASSYTATIVELEKARAEAVAEAVRAKQVAAKLQALVS